MQDVTIVGVLKRGRDLEDEAAHLGQGQRAAKSLEALQQCATMDQPHNDVNQFAFLAVPMNLEQIWMVELRQASRLIVESLAETNIPRKFWVQDLDGHIGVERAC